MAESQSLLLSFPRNKTGRAVSGFFFDHVPSRISKEEFLKRVRPRKERRESFPADTEEMDEDRTRPLVVGIGGAAYSFLREGIEKELEATIIHVDDRATYHPLAKGWKMLFSELKIPPNREGLKRYLIDEYRTEISLMLYGFAVQCSKIFVVAGLGGHLGSSCLTEIVDILRESGKPVCALATMPFKFEGEKRRERGYVGLDEVCRHADEVHVLELDFCIKNAPYLAKTSQLIRMGTSIMSDYLQKLVSSSSIPERTKYKAKVFEIKQDNASTRYASIFEERKA